MNTDLQNLAIEAAKMLAIHSTWMLLLVFALSKRFRNTFLKRTLWRSTFVALSLLILLTFSGLHQWDWLSIQTINQKPQVDAESPSQWKPLILVEPQSPDIISLPTNTLPAETLESAHSANALSFAIALGVAWLSGSISFLTLMIFNATAWRWRLRRQTQPASDHLKSVFNQAAKRLSFTRTPTLAESSHLTSPLVMGCVHPVIVFPKDHASRYQPEEQHLIMCHEIAHLREHDGWWQCLANLVAITLWWNPVVWLARQSLRQTAEETADSISVGHDKEGEQLAACLVRIGREISSTQWTGSLSIFGAGFRSQLGKRVERLLKSHPTMHIQPKPLMTGAIRLLTPVLLITILSGSTSRLGLSRTESASDSIQRSVFGMMLLAEDTKPITAPSANTQEHRNESEQRDASTNQTPSTEVTSEQRLKSIVIPQFKYSVSIHSNNDLQAHNLMKGVDQTVTSLENLRDSIIKVDPSWENLTFQIRLPSKEEKGNDPTTLGLPPKNSVNVIVVGPITEVSKEMPVFDRFSKISHSTITPETGGVSSMNAVGYINMQSKSAYELLFGIMRTFDIENYHYFGQDTVVFDLNHIEGASPQNLGSIFPAEDDPHKLSLSPLQTSDPRTIKIEDLPVSSQEPDTNALYTRTFKVNPDTFIERMEAVLGYPKPTKTQQTWSNVQDLVQDFLSKIGIEMPNKDQRAMPNQDLKACFFNDRNGTLYVRLHMHDLEILEAALAVLQEPGERNTKVTLDMRIVQLDESGMKVLEEFGFDKPDGENSGQFEHIIDTPTLQRLLLRMNLASGIELLQSPHITALNGRQSELKAQELRRIVTHNESGNIQTEEVATGPTLSVIPRLQANGHLELTAHFELLEFVGYDDPGPFSIVLQNDNPTIIRKEIVAGIDDASTVDKMKKEQLMMVKQVNLERIQTILKQIESSTESDTVEIILQQMPLHKGLTSLISEREQLQIDLNNIEGRVALNPKDLNQLKTQKSRLTNIIKSWDIRIQQECAEIVAELKSLLQVQQNELKNITSIEPEQQPGNIPNTEILNQQSQNNQIPLPRFKRLELNTKTNIQSGQTLVMGGLKSTETIRWKNNVPIMSKIPLLGGMFRREGTSTTEQYIYVLITPRILK